MAQQHGKHDNHARQHWGYAAFNGIPKSVFATVAWHLANVASGECDSDGAAVRRFREELDMMIANGFIPEAQGKRALKALAEQ